jgi:DUF1365 family protein
MSDLFHHALFQGTVWHERVSPAHRFHQKVSMLYVNLDELETVFSASVLLADHGLSPAKFQRKDYTGNPNEALGTSIRKLVTEQLGFTPEGPITVLANMRTWGWLFNPIVIFWCFDRDGALCAQVLGVTNTPWHEYDNYVFDRRDPERPMTTPKTHHVSPFFPMDLTYSVHDSLPDSHLSFRLEVDKHSTPVFAAGLELDRRALTTSSLATALLRHPTQRVSLGIYTHALHLVRKGATFIPHPKKSRQSQGIPR